VQRWTKFEAQSFFRENQTYTYDDDNRPNFTDDAYLALELKTSTIFKRDNRAFEGDCGALVQFCLATALSYISEIKRLCDSRNIGLTIVLIPDEMQVSKPLQTRVVVASGLPPASFDFTLPNKSLRARFEELKIDYIDLLTEFSAHSLNDRLYRPNDSHWNIAGNELAARLILQHVSAQLRPVDKSHVRFTPKNGHWPDRRLNSSGQDFIKILRGWSTNYPSWEFWPHPPSRRLREQTLGDRLRLINAAPRSRASTPGQHGRSST
jgi:hypothetical protein